MGKRTSKRAGDVVGRGRVPRGVLPVRMSAGEGSVSGWDELMRGYQIHLALGELWKAVQAANQLIEARIEALQATDAIASGDALTVCGKVLRIVIDDLLQRASEQAGDGFINPFPPPHHLDQPGWVANRWSEMLPIELEQKQSLLEITDDGERLLRVEQYLRENGVI